MRETEKGTENEHLQGQNSGECRSHRGRKFLSDLLKPRQLHEGRKLFVAPHGGNPFRGAASRM